MEMIVRIDRRAEVVEEVLDELKGLSESVRGLDVLLVEREAFDSARDEGKFRDFVEIARLTHESAEALEIVAEELVERFGWLVDVTQGE
jgi:hypothetical protein